MSAAGERADLLEIPASGDLDESRAAESEILGLHLSGSRPPLFLLRSWLTEIEDHRALARGLGPDQPVYSIAPPVGTAPEHFPGSADEWADFCLDRVDRIPHDGPYHLGGWSFGGVLALEVAEKLLMRGREVAIVLMIDTRVPKPHPPRRRRKLKRGHFHKTVRRLYELLELRTREERIAYARHRFRRRFRKLRKKLDKALGRGPAAAPRKPPTEFDELPWRTGDPESLLKRAVWVCYLKYRPGPRAIRVAQFWTQESMLATGDSGLGWTPILRGEYEGVEIPGEHFTLYCEPHLSALVAALARTLRRVREGL